MKKIILPLSEEEKSTLKAGDAVSISGIVYTARDAAHKRMMEAIQEGKELPFPLQNATIYYVGPTPAKPGQAIGSAGPTTSSRMDAYTPTLLDRGLGAMLGKGKRSQEVKEAIVRNKAIYFIACGGAGALISHCVKKREMIAYEDLLSEAVTRLEVEDLPCFVGIDMYGNDIYEKKDEE